MYTGFDLRGYESERLLLHKILFREMSENRHYTDNTYIIPLLTFTEE